MVIPSHYKHIKLRDYLDENAHDILAWHCERHPTRISFSLNEIVNQPSRPFMVSTLHGPGPHIVKDSGWKAQHYPSAFAQVHKVHSIP